MNQLGAILYDPAVAVSKATSALLALTAFDTTNLRLTVTVPAHGRVFFKLKCNLTGATTSPTVLLGVLNGATVVGRVMPQYENATANAATQSFEMVAEFTATGLAAGSTAFDAAYAVQVIVASTNIKYGGPNTNAGANAWGGFVFEAWDPTPMQTNGQLVIDASGRVDVSKVGGTTQTARDLGASVLLSPGTGTGQIDLTAGVPKVNVTQLLGTAWLTPAVAGTPDVNAKLHGGTVQTGRDIGASVLLAASQHVIVDSGTVTTVTNQLTAAQIATGVWQDATAGDFTAAGSVGKSLMNGVALGTGLTISTVSGAVGSVTGAVGSVTAAVTVGTNNDKAGYALTQAFPTNFSSLVIDSTGRVNAFLIGILTTVFTEGAAGRIAAAFKQFFNIATPAATMDHGILVDTVTTYTGNTLQTGDTFARVGAAGAGLTALGDTRIANLDTTVSSRTKPADTQAAVTTVTTTTNLTNLPSIPANWLTAAGVAASALNGKGDWNIGKTGYALSAAGVQAIWDALTSALTTVNSIGKLLVTNIDAAISSRLAASSYVGADNTDIALIKAKTDNLPASPAATGDAMTLTAGERTSIAAAVWGAAVRTLSAFGFTVDTNANATETAIKAKTDSLTFTKAGEVDSNVQSVNDAAVKGDGKTGTEWGPV